MAHPSNMAGLVVVKGEIHPACSNISMRVPYYSENALHFLNAHRSLDELQKKGGDVTITSSSENALGSFEKKSKVSLVLTPGVQYAAG